MQFLRRQRLVLEKTPLSKSKRLSISICPKLFLGVCPRWLATMCTWHLGTGYHLQFVLACSHFLSSIAREALLRVHFLMLLLFWDFYHCPSSLAVASACLRYGTLTQFLVHSLWGYLCFHSVLPHTLLMLDQRRTVAARGFLKSLLLFSQFFCLVVLFSTLSILDQTSKSVPNFLGVGGKWLLPLSACIGVIQAFSSMFVTECTVSRSRFAVEVCDLFTRSRLRSDFFKVSFNLSGHLHCIAVSGAHKLVQIPGGDFFGYDTVAVAMRFRNGVSNGQNLASRCGSSLRSRLQFGKSLYDCGCDAVHGALRFVMPCAASKLKMLWARFHHCGKSVA